MPSKDIYPESTLQELRERVSYEDLLLQTVSVVSGLFRADK